MPWDEVVGQARAVATLQGALARGQVHHAYLVTGPAGVGKEALSRLFAQAANCEAEQALRPCGTCYPCTAIARGSYPDVIWVMPQAELVARGKIAKGELDAAPSREIRVDEVRGLEKRLSLAALHGRRKVAILLPADALNERAQNALLKTLEEPPAGTTFLLVTAHPDSLLPTVRSRCARLQLAPLGEAALVQALVARGLSPAEAALRASRAEGSLGEALRLDAEQVQRERQLLGAAQAALAAEDERAALDLAEQSSEREAAFLLVAALSRWTRDELVTPAPTSALSPRGWLDQHALCEQIRESLEGNGNPRLQLERLLLSLRELRTPRREAAHG